MELTCRSREIPCKSRRFDMGLRDPQGWQDILSRVPMRRLATMRLRKELAAMTCCAAPSGVRRQGKCKDLLWRAYPLVAVVRDCVFYRHRSDHTGTFWIFRECYFSNWRCWHSLAIFATRTRGRGSPRGPDFDRWRSQLSGCEARRGYHAFLCSAQAHVRFVS